MIEYIHSWWTKITCRKHAEAGTDTITPRTRHEGVSAETCPCIGDHWPSMRACRWCTCHDPSGLYHHGPGGEPASMILPRYRPDEIMVPGNFTFLLKDSPAQPDKIKEQRECPLTVDGTGCRDGSMCDAEGRCAARAVIEAYEHREKLMDTRPSNKIVTCGACGHPQHTAGGGRCSFLLPQTGRPDDFVICLCEAGTDVLMIDGEQP